MTRSLPPFFHSLHSLSLFHSFCARSNKISPLVSMTYPLFVTLEKISPPCSEVIEEPKEKDHTLPPLLCSSSPFRSFRTRSNKIAPLFSTTYPLFVTLEKISSLFTYSSQKHPGVGGCIVSLSRKLRDNRSVHGTRSSRVTNHWSPVASAFVNISLLRSVPRPAEKPYLPSQHPTNRTRSGCTLPSGEANSCNPILLNC